VLEFNLPPIRFDDVGSPGFYLSSARTSLFGGILAVDPGAQGSYALEDAGFQMDWNFSIAVRLPMTLSIGDAIGIRSGRVERNEVMVSLKIL
jgi:hypothetical protein